MADFKKWLNSLPVLNDTVTDPIAPYQDAQHTTIENVLRLLTVDKYTPTDKLDALQVGVIMKEITDPSQFEYSQKQEIESLNRTADKVPRPRYKILLLGRPGSHAPIPDNFQEPAIEALDDYSVAPGYEGSLSLGIVVYVNIEKRTIEHSEDASINETISDLNSTAGSKDAFDEPINEGAQGIINMQTIPEDITEGEAWKGGASLGKIKLKYIVSYNKQRLRADVADKFNEMVKAAAKDNIKLVASSGFRDHKAQITIYNDRFVNKYPVPKDQRRANPLTENGKRIGVAAYPGTSNHQSGVAVDIDMGKHLAESNRYAGEMGKHPAYLWLVNNASKYGFDNTEGRKVNEPWHWVYNNNPTSKPDAEVQKES